MSRNSFSARPSYGMDCEQCGDVLIAPETSECVGERHIRHVWHCQCGCRFEETSYLCANAGTQRIEMRRHDVSLPGQHELLPAAGVSGRQTPTLDQNSMLFDRIVRTARAAICRI